jgi:large subunit ribosomal protein L2
MALKKYNPLLLLKRVEVRVDRSELWKGEPHKPLTEGIHKTGGRNNTGRITSRHRGGGHKRLYRLLILNEISLIVWRTIERLNMIQIEQLL